MFLIYLCFVILLIPLNFLEAGLVDGSLTIKNAEKLTTDNKPDSALKILLKYKPEDKELSKYHYVCYKAYEKQGNMHEAITHLRLSYLYASEENEKEQLLLERANIYYKNGYYPEASSTYRQFIRYYSKSDKKEEARLGLADALFMQGLFIEALLNYEEAGINPRAILGKANIYQSMDRVEDAQKLYMSVLSAKDFVQNSPETMFNLAENFRMSGKFSEAKAYYNSIKDSRVKLKAFIGLGLIAMSEGKYEDAIKYFTMSNESIDRKIKVKALLNLSEAYLRIGKKNEAKNILLDIQKKYYYSRDYDLAILKLARILKNEGNFKEALVFLKEISTKKSPPKEAIDEFESIILESINNNKDDVLRLWNIFGRLLLEPQRSKSLIKIAEALRISGKPFLELCIWLTKNGTTDIKSRSNLLLSDFYAEIGDIKKASNHIKYIKGNSDEILRVKAKILREKKDYQKAMDTLLSIKSLNPNDIVFFAELLESSKNMKKSVDFCEDALKKIGAPLKVYIKLADTLYRMGREADALKFYQIVASLKPETRKDLTSEDAGWTYYMVSKLSKDDSLNIKNHEALKNNIYSKSAEAVLKESDIQERIKRIF